MGKDYPLKGITFGIQAAAASPLSVWFYRKKPLLSVNTKLLDRYAGFQKAE